MGCQKKIAEQIKRQGGDYVFSLKGNPCPELVEGKAICMTMLKHFSLRRYLRQLPLLAMMVIMVELKPAPFVRQPI